MRQELEHGRVPLQVRCGYALALACIAVMGLTPATAWAEEEAVEVPGDTAIDEADEATEAVTPEDIDGAQKAIDEAQRQLDAMKQRIGEYPVKIPSQMPGGAGLVTGADGTAKKLQVSLNKDGTLYFRFATWLQIWARAMQLNPGTEVLGDQDNWYGDVGIRRARFLMFGKIAPRIFLLMHIGINNQTFRNARKPQVYFHDAWVEFEAETKGHLSIGAGLLYWNGISRMTNASTITLMSLDAPIVNWPTIERSDQFARQLGFYAKGKVGLFDYRVAVTRPFTTYDPATADPTTGVGIYNTAANTWGYAGYFMLQFKDIESNTLPYTVGTYIGAKKVFNWGFGGYAQPKGTVYLSDPADPASIRERTQFVASTDLFLDIPFKAEKGGAATWYAVYYYQDFGPNNIRPIGIMNPADPGTGLNGGGNAYTLLGTGNTGYSEFGILIPGTVGESIQFQPYVNTQLSKWEAYDDIMAHFGLGVNMFIHKHNAKVSLEYRNRPIFNADGTLESRKGNSFVLQMHLFI